MSLLLELTGKTLGLPAAISSVMKTNMPVVE